MKNKEKIIIIQTDIIKDSLEIIENMVKRITKVCKKYDIEIKEFDSTRYINKLTNINANMTTLLKDKIIKG